MRHIRASIRCSNSARCRKPVLYRACRVLHAAHVVAFKSGTSRLNIFGQSCTHIFRKFDDVVVDQTIKVFQGNSCLGPVQIVGRKGLSKR